MGLFSLIKSLVITHLLLGYIFVASGLVVNFLMLCNMLLFWYIYRPLYRRINSYLAYLLWSEFSFLSQWWTGSDCVLYADPEDMKKVGKTHCIVICNHTYDIDWLMAWMMAERYGLLGSTKIYGKEILQYIPIIGWAWYFTESIFLKRDWEKDRKILTDSMAQLSEYPDDVTVNLLLFPEGTRFTEEKHIRTVEICKEKGYPQLKHHLLPRTKAFVTTLQVMNRKIPNVIDITVSFPIDEPEPTLMEVIRGRKVKGHMRVRVFDVDKIPKESEEECSNWLRQLFKEKDDALDGFLKTGKFELPVNETPRRKYDLFVFIFWSVLTLVPLFYFLSKLFLAGTLYQQVVFIVIVVLVTVVLRLMIRVSEIKESSSKYGVEAKKTN